MKWGFEQKAKLTIGIFFILWLAAMILSGCMTAQKATDYLKDKGKLAEVCLTEFPFKDSVLYLPGDTVFDVITIPGDTLIHFDTIWRNQYGYKVDTIMLRCPPNKTITKTVIDSIKVTREDPRRIDLLTGRIKGLEQKLEKETERANYWKSKAKHRMGLVNWLIAILLALLIYTFRKPIFKAAYKLIRPF